MLSKAAREAARCSEKGPTREERSKSGEAKMGLPRSNSSVPEEGKKLAAHIGEEATTDWRLDAKGSQTEEMQRSMEREE